MRNTWQLQEAKNQFSRVVDRALVAGAQTITRHGKAVAVVLSQEEYLQRGRPRKKSFAEMLLSIPKVELNLERDKQPVRPVEFE
ncbi:MAG: type II toxin-antitoxin system Phd/YefM family antitoxin [Verrucomicrobia bacterium]|nr:type II toxin-antitoxin system Phd/YefM family antitoxin [Verrucomicrobiota bacterium]